MWASETLGSQRPSLRGRAGIAQRVTCQSLTLINPCQVLVGIWVSPEKLEIWLLYSRRGSCVALDGVAFTMPLSMALDAEITGQCQRTWLGFVAFK